MIWKYLWHVLRHKWFVFVECVRLGIPWLGVIHDLSKFSLAEFLPYARNLFGDYPTEEAVNKEWCVAWLHHQNANKHHPEYWELRGRYQPGCLPMPEHYRREMLADLIGAGRANGKLDARAWYLKVRDELQLHPETRAWIEEQLNVTDS